MKTFKMMAFDIVTESNVTRFPIQDGILINQENSHQLWILELFLPKEYKAIFEEKLASGELFHARAVISIPDNEPAPFAVVVDTIKEIGDHISVLLKGRLRAQRKKYAEMLLYQLLEEGWRNEELLERFERGMRERPSLKNSP
ncbi:MAG: YwpF family protein [Solibacillus sp.]